MILRLIPIFAILAFLGLAACQEESAETEGSEAETGQTDGSATENSN